MFGGLGKREGSWVVRCSENYRSSRVKLLSCSQAFLELFSPFLCLRGCGVECFTDVSGLTDALDTGVGVGAQKCIHRIPRQLHVLLPLGVWKREALPTCYDLSCCRARLSVSFPSSSTQVTCNRPWILLRGQ